MIATVAHLPHLKTGAYSSRLMLTQPEIEGTAESLYRSAGEDPSEVVSPAVIAGRILGSGSIRVVHASSLPGDAELVRIYDRWYIYVRRGLSDERLRFGIAHELGEHALRTDGCQGQEVEEIANRLAGALLAPARAVRLAMRECGPRFTRLARVFVSTQSCAALRVGEATGAPIALVAPQRVRVRGESFEWPSEEQVRDMARRKLPGPGIARVRLTDDPKRVVLDCSAALLVG